MAQSCGTCKFFSAIEKECRKNPPALLPVMRPDGKPAAMGVWPPTNETKWCGAHEQTEQAKETP